MEPLRRVSSIIVRQPLTLLIGEEGELLMPRRSCKRAALR
jgi:hypothetical protein